MNLMLLYMVFLLKKILIVIVKDFDESLILWIVDKLEEKDLPAGINLDGEPLSKSELRELEKLDGVFHWDF